MGHAPGERIAIALADTGGDSTCPLCGQRLEGKKISMVVVGSGKSVHDECGQERDPELWEVYWRAAQDYGVRKLSEAAERGEIGMMVIRPEE